MTNATNRRAVLGVVLAAGALAAFPAGTVAAGLDEAEPDLHALIAAWHETSRRSEESFEALLAASARAICPVPQSLIATESDASQWSKAIAGKQYRERDVDTLRPWMNMSRRPNHPALPGNVLPGSEFDDRAREIIASWDSWQAEQRVAEDREGVLDASDLHEQAVENYKAMGHRVAKLQAKTMAGVVAKLLAAATEVTEDDLEGDADFAILAGAALDALALANVRGEEAAS